MSGVRLGFSLHGPPPSEGDRVAAKPAKIEFVARFLDSVREQTDTGEEPLGELLGEVKLLAGPDRALFVCDESSLKKLTEPAEPDEAPVEASEDEDVAVTFEPKEIELNFPSNHFDGAETVTAKDKARLILPKKAKESRFVEVRAKLSVAGNEESAFTRNDVLDVPIRLASPPGYPFSL